jgi:transposase
MGNEIGALDFQRVEHAGDVAGLRLLVEAVLGLGRKPKATDEYCLKLETLLAKDPSECGYRFAIWTSDRLRIHLKKETGILLSESRFRALLKKKGYRYRRPKHDLSHLQDAQAKKKATKLLEEMKKRASETISNSSLWTK